MQNAQPLLSPAQGSSEGGAPALRFPGRTWPLDPSLTFLNHGSYGATPVSVQSVQTEFRSRMERDPVRFYKADLEGLMDGLRRSLASFLNCRADDIAPMPNATAALCTILRNCGLKAGDEVLITDHEYQSLLNELERICAETGARVVKAEIPLPITDPQNVVDRFLASITPRTRIAFISHVTSATSIVMPVAPIVKEFNRRGIDIVVDGAHSPGQIPVDLAGLAPTFFVGSGHKWLCGPKGTGFIVVRADRQATFRPLALSSRAAKVRPDRSRFLRDFDYQGTDDYSGLLSIPAAIDCLGSMLPGGWPELMRRNHMLALEAGRRVAAALGAEPLCPPSMTGCMVTLRLPEVPESLRGRPTRYDDALQDALLERHGVICPIWRLNAAPWSASPSGLREATPPPAGQGWRVVRLSAHLYNTPEQYTLAGDVLTEELRREASPAAGRFAAGA